MPELTQLLVAPVKAGCVFFHNQHDEKFITEFNQNAGYVTGCLPATTPGGVRRHRHSTRCRQVDHVNEETVVTIMSGRPNLSLGVFLGAGAEQHPDANLHSAPASVCNRDKHDMKDFMQAPGLPCLN